GFGYCFLLLTFLDQRVDAIQLRLRQEVLCTVEFEQGINRVFRDVAELVDGFADSDSRSSFHPGSSDSHQLELLAGEATRLGQFQHGTTSTTSGNAFEVCDGVDEAAKLPAAGGGVSARRDERLFQIEG